MSEIDQDQVPGIYHHRIGDILVTALSDGYLDVPLDAIRNFPVDQARDVLTANCRPVAPRCSVNAFLVRSGGRLALIETGSGNTMGPTLGWLPKNLRRLGIDPAKIETVLLTHMHPDHSNGLTDDAGAPLFPECELVLHEEEVAHWHDDARMARVPERQAVRYFQGARIQFAPYRDRARLFRSGEVLPGITAMPIPGHTPGHTAYLISSGSESLLVWGDVVHFPDLQIPHPEACMEFDSDSAAAAATRRRVFDMVATDRLLIVGPHLHFPAFSYLVRDAGGYRLLPEPWRFVP
ncbi:MAG: MBL fold metallo-hydrolase [Xanthobacteraceae bacterium]|nr:MBL fold metallo-hydrolase [Xanthobacteraceae bacterium]PWB63779.1 MAG: MBL fold metallo-hydrolase [Bradyrhizobiaceae bacterium]